MSRYINPYTDFGFKKLFGEEASKDLLMSFLNALLPKKHKVKTLTFKSPYQLSAAKEERSAVFDVFCENAQGEQFIVEMQKAEQDYFKDRSLYYVTHPIRNQAKQGKWNYGLKAVYFVGILDFLYEKESDNPVIIREVSLKDQFGKEFYPKLNMIYIQMPAFKKNESELESKLDKWLYFLKNLPGLEHIPSILNEKVFERAFHTAELTAMSQEEQAAYEQAQNDYRTYWATIETAVNQGRKEGLAEGLAEGRAVGLAEGRTVGLAEGRTVGRAEGIAEGIAEGRAEGLAKGRAVGIAEGRAVGITEGERQKALGIARQMLADGVPMDMVVKYTGLTKREIEQR